MKDVVRKVVEKWPTSGKAIAGYGPGKETSLCEYARNAVPDEKLRRGVRRLMRRVSLAGQREVLRRAVRETPCEMATFLPDWRDRSHAAREVLLGDVLAYRSQTAVRRPTLYARRKVFAYVDVSGSMEGKIPAIAQALLPYITRNACELHVFSTEVYPVGCADLMVKRFCTTGGTDFNCVLEHLLSRSAVVRPGNVVVFTDGRMAPPDASLVARIRRAGVRFCFGLVREGEQGNVLWSLARLSKVFVDLE